jgi:hypothetical protein
MKLPALAVFAVLAATPALAAAAYPDDVSVPPQSNAAASPSDIDADIAAKDAARQSYYQNKLDAANAQAKIDDAQAVADQAASERDAALNRADQDRNDIHHPDQ